MTLDVLDELTLARLGRVEVWVSLYWDEPYNTDGEFTLEVRPTEENLSLLREGRWLRRADSDVPMRICHRSNENADSNLVVTGFPGTWIFTKRACTSTVKSENAEAAMRRLVSAMQPWPKLELGAAVGFDTTYTAQTSGGSIMDYLMTIGAACDLGFRVRQARTQIRSCCSRSTGPPPTPTTAFPPSGATCSRPRGPLATATTPTLLWCRALARARTGPPSPWA